MRYKSIFFLSLVPFSILGWGTNYTWNEPGSGTWNLDASWTPNTGFPSAATDTATFVSPPLTGAATVSITDIGTAAAGQITFNAVTTGQLTIGDDSTETLYLGGDFLSPTINVTNTTTSPIQFSANLVFEGDISIDQNSSSTFTFAGGSSDRGDGYGLSITGTGNITLLGTNSYTGPTVVSAASLIADAMNTLAPGSDFTLENSAFLTINNQPNVINSLSNGAGGLTTSVLTGTSAILTISNGGSYNGNILGSGGLALTGGTLEITSNSLLAYGGPTTLSNSAVLLVEFPMGLSPNSAIILQDASTLELLSTSTVVTIPSLTGDVNTHVMIGLAAGLQITDGGTFNGQIQGGGKLDLQGGTLTLSNNNSYSGGTTIDASSILALTGVGQLDPTGNVIDNGTFDITGINTSTAIGNLTGTGTVLIADKTLVINTSASSTFSGDITGTTGSLQIQGTSTAILSGTNAYTGSTTVAAGSTLQAGSITALAPSSAFTVAGTLALNNFSNTINTLAGGGSVTLGTALLTISNGGNFSGVISGTGGSLTLSAGTLTLSGTNTYNGTTTIAGGTLALSAGGRLSALTSVVANGTFDISGIAPSGSQSITSLSGTGYVNLGSNGLVLLNTAPSAFDGIISGLGGSLTYTPTGAFTFTLGGLNTYTGPTIVNNGTLAAGIANAFAPSSAFGLNGGATLSLANFPNTIGSLSGAGTVSTGGASGILTISNGGTFSGGITGAGGVDLTGGDLTLSGVGLNTYTGATTLSNDATLTAGAMGAFPASSDVNLQNTSQLALSTDNTVKSLSGDIDSIVMINSGAVLTINNGGTFDGAIQGAGGVEVAGGTLALSNNNTYSDGTTIDASATLALTGVGQLSPSGFVLDNGTFDITGINASTAIGNLSGSGMVLLGSKMLIINTSGGTSTFTGSIQGVNGSLQIQGSGTLQLSGTNSYTGATTVAAGSILQAGAANVFAPLSNYTITGTLALNNFPNTINTLSGGGSVTTGGALGILTLSNGGAFSGVISGLGGLTLDAGTLTLTGANTYIGLTTISGGTLSLSAGGSLASTTSVVADGVFDISGISSGTQTIANLSGSGDVNLGSNELVFGTGVSSSFSGAISGIGGSLTYQGTAIFTLTGNSNTYTGPTLVESGTFAAGVPDAFAPLSDYTIDGTLSLGGFSNIINSLSGTGTVSTGGGILTISDGGSFSGGITGSGGLDLTGGALTLSGSGLNTYSGPTNLSNAATLTAGAANAFSASSDMNLQDTSQLDLATFDNTVNSLSGDIDSLALIGLGATLTINNGGTFDGEIQGAGGVEVAGGTLYLSNNNTYSGGTTIDAPGTLALTGVGQLDPNGFVTDNGTLDITAVDTSAAIGNLTGSGTVLLAAKTLIVNTSAPSTFSGSIQGVNGSLQVQGSSTLTLSGTNNTYSGQTSVGAGSTLQAGAAGAFAPLSSYTITGTLDLNNFPNTINTLSGGGGVTTGGALGILTVSNGGAFSGVISGLGGLTLDAGTLTLTGANTYTGLTTIAGGTLSLSAGGSLASTTSVVADGVFDISGINSGTQTIADLSGTGDVNLGSNELVFGTSDFTAFSGAISGIGGSLTYQGTGQFTLTGNSNTYTGPTIVESGIFAAGVTDAFAPLSDYTVDLNATLSLGGFNNVINTLSGAGIVSTGGGILTISAGGSFSGGIIGSGGGLDLTGGDLILSGTNNTYSGPTILSNSAILTAGAVNAFSPTSDVTLQDTSELDLGTFNNTINSLSGGDDTLVLVGSGATLGINEGGTFNGQIQGAGGVELVGGTLTLSNNNTFSGGTTIDAPGTLALTGVGQLNPNGFVVDNGTFDITNINATTAIGNLTGSGTVLLADKTLVVNTSGGTSIFSGSIQGIGGSLQVQGSGTLQLSGANNTYTGETTVGAGSTLQAGTTGAFAPLSSYTVTGILDLNNFPNTINTLAGGGSVTLGAATLTISSGGNFSGVISGTGGLALSAGLLTLTGINTYTGNTTISGGTLLLSGTGSLSPLTTVTANGTFDISTINAASETIANLQGNGYVNLGDKELLLGNNTPSIFSGSISGIGGSLTYQGTSTFTLAGSSNTYTGPTTINSGGTIAAGVANAFAPLSDFTVNGTLSLAGFPNTINSLSGTGAVTTGGTSGILTISDGGAFSGGITGSGGISLTGGDLTLSGSGSNTYSGPTTLSNDATLTAGAVDAFSPSSDVTLQDTSTLDLSTFSNTINSLSGDISTLALVGSGATLTINDGGTFNGQIQGAGAVEVAGGTLYLSNNNTYMGGTTIDPSATLALTGVGQLYPIGAVVDNGTFDITQINSSTTIGNLTGSGTVLLANKTLVVNATSPSTFSGSIQGIDGSLQTTGSSILTLSGTNNTYTGPTVVGAGSTLQAGATNAFAPLSSYTVSGTLDLNNFANTINSLFGGGSVTTGGVAGILTLSNGGTFSGGISGLGGLTLAGGTLNLTTTTMANTYSGPTMVLNNTTLSAGAANALSPNSALTLSGTLLLNNFPNAINSLFGPGTVNTGNITAAGILTISNGGSFSGGITGLGGLNLTGGTLDLTTISMANTYSGPTTISGATLEAGAVDAFSPFSAYTLLNTATLALNGFNNTIFSLSSADPTSRVTLGQAILTIDGDVTTTFAGSITNFPCGGLTITGEII